MPSRKEHTKSRHGCSICKARRVKCDLALPECSHCVRRNESCSLGRDYDRRGSPQNGPANAVPSHKAEYLLEKFSSCVSVTISDKPECQRVWASLIISVNGPYLKHSMIALSALYVARTHKDLAKSKAEDYLYLAARHQTTAMSMLGPQISNLNEKNCEAVFATASLIFLGAAASSLSHTFMRLDRVVEISKLARGVYAVVRRAPATLRTRLLKPLVNIEYRNIEKELPTKLSRPLLQLRDCIGSAPVDIAKKAIYWSAVDLLDKVMRWNVYSSCHTLIVFVWLALVDRSFMELAIAQDPIALRIIGQFGIYSMEASSVWWLRGLGESIVNGMQSSIKDLGI